MSLLHLYITNSDGTIELDTDLSSSKMKLVKYCIRWNDKAGSTSNGELINVNIFNDGILSSIVNSNKTKDKNFLPLANDTENAITIQSLDMAFNTQNKIRNRFKYSLRNKNGNSLTSFVSLQLWFEYF